MEVKVNGRNRDPKINTPAAPLTRQWMLISPIETKDKIQVLTGVCGGVQANVTSQPRRKP